MPRELPFDYVVPGTPSEISERLGSVTRRVTFNHQSSVFGKGGLQGRVDAEGFCLSDDAPHVFRQPRCVAYGTLEPVAEGTRVHGVIRMPTWMTWQMRIAFVFLTLLMGGGSINLALQEGLLPGLGFAAFAVAFLGLAVVFLGRWVAGAQDGLEPLLGRLHEFTGAGEAASDAEAERVRAPGQRVPEG